eukprot:g4400.t1
MQFFRCQTIDGESYMMVDYGLKCYDSSWYAFLALVVLVLVFLAVGAPAVMTWVLFKKRHIIWADAKKAKEDKNKEEKQSVQEGTIDETKRDNESPAQAGKDPAWEYTDGQGLQWRRCWETQRAKYYYFVKNDTSRTQWTDPSVPASQPTPTSETPPEPGSEKKKKKKPPADPLTILYKPYKPERYYYEAVKMIFKLALWCALVIFEEGSEMQLGSALIINTIQLVVHIYLLPLEGTLSTPAWQINSLETGSLVLICFIAFGGFATNYLEISLQAFPEREAQIKGSIGSLDITMQVLAFLQFGSMIYLLARDHWKKRKQHIETFRRMRSRVSSTASRIRFYV